MVASWEFPSGAGGSAVVAKLGCMAAAVMNGDRFSSGAMSGAVIAGAW
jgi:hypothetical protein